MTQADHIIPRDFNGIKIELIKNQEEFWFTADTLGSGLEYKNPRISIMNLYSSRKDELEEYSSVIEIVTEAGMRKTTVFNEMGAYLLIMFSNQPRAKEFRKWIASVIKKIRKTGSYIQESQDPLDLMVKQADMLKNAFIQLKEQNQKLNILENKVHSVDVEIKTFEQKYEDQRIITPQTLKIITDTCQFAHKCTGRHWGYFYSIIWEAFGIRSTKGISEKLGQKIITWMKDHPFFKKYLQMNEVS